MDIMDTARLNIKRRREIKGLRQQDMAEKLNMNIRSYQNLEGGSTKLDLERLGQLAEILETTIEELLKQEGLYIHQEINEIKDSGSGFVYHQEISNALIEKVIAAKESENQALKEEIRYLQEKVNQFIEMIGKKG